MANREDYGDGSSPVWQPQPYETAQANSYDPGRFNAIQGYYTKYLGRTPGADDQGLMGWVNNGSMSLTDAEKNISGSSEAQDYAKSRNNQSSGQQTNGQSTTQDWNSGPWDANRVSSYFQSRGVTPNASSPDYWAGKWNEWGSKDPNYFLQRLSNADELIGGPQNSPFYEGGNQQNNGQNYRTGPDPMMQALLDRINQQAAQAEQDRQAQRAKADALYGQLEDRSKQSLAIDRNDPVIHAQSAAYGAQTDRASRNYLADLAEAKGPLANIQGQSRIMAEQAGQAKGGFEAQLMGQELQSRRAEISDALNSMRGMLSSDQQANLQRELSSLDAAINTQQMQYGQNNFADQLKYNYANLAQNNDQFGRNLSQNQNQFNSTQAYNYENMDNAMLRYYYGML